jgi:hypothetical protein
MKQNKDKWFLVYKGHDFIDSRDAQAGLLLHFPTNKDWHHLFKIQHLTNIAEESDIMFCAQ